MKNYISATQKLCRHLQKWGSLHMGVIKLLQTGENQFCGHESWKYPSITSRNFCLLSHLNIFLTIDLSHTDTSSGLSPDFFQLLNTSQVGFDPKTCPCNSSLQSACTPCRLCYLCFLSKGQSSWTAPEAATCSTVWRAAVPLALCMVTVYIHFLFTWVHIKITRNHVQTNQGHDCSVFVVYVLRCYVISVISSSLQWIPLFDLFLLLISCSWLPPSVWGCLWFSWWFLS